jgi:hypothetical protein
MFSVMMTRRLNRSERVMSRSGEIWTHRAYTAVVLVAVGVVGVAVLIYVQYLFELPAYRTEFDRMTAKATSPTCQHEMQRKKYGFSSDCDAADLYVMTSPQLRAFAAAVSSYSLCARDTCRERLAGIFTYLMEFAVLAVIALTAAVLLVRQANVWFRDSHVAAMSLPHSYQQLSLASPPLPQQPYSAPRIAYTSMGSGGGSPTVVEIDGDYLGAAPIAQKSKYY